MSSTARGKTREASDYYKTPIPPIAAFLRAWREDLIEAGQGGGFENVLDPCAGGDEENEMSYPVALRQSDLISPVARITTLDIRRDSRAEIKADFLNWSCAPKTFDLVISNPPFTLAEKFITKSLGLSSKYVVKLQRLNFFGTSGRLNFFHSHMPRWAYVNAERISFSTPLLERWLEEHDMVSKKGQDSIEYAHFVWDVNYKPKFTQLRVISQKVVQSIGQHALFEAA